MRFLFLKIPIQDIGEIKNLQQLRERLLNVLLISAFLMGIVVYLTALIPVFQKELFKPPLAYTVLFLWLILVTFVRRIPYSARAGSWLIFLYLLGLINLVLSGLNVDGGLFFLTFISMAALLFDLRRGMIALAISSVTIALAGYAVVLGYVDLQLALPQTAPLLWIIGGMILVVAGVFLILSLSVLLRGLVLNLTRATLEAEQLEQANRALSVSEERYRTLVEISPDLVTLVGLDGKIIMTNKPGLEMFGYELAEVTGRGFLILISPEDHSRLEASFQKTLDAGSDRDVVCQCVRKDGTLFYAEFSASLLVDGNGRPQAVIGVGRDITVRRNAELMLQNAREKLEYEVAQRTAELQSANERLKQAEESYRILLENSMQGIIVFQDDRVVYANRAIMESFGFELDEVKSLTSAQIFSYVHPDDRALVWGRYQSRLAGQPLSQHHETRIFQKNGEMRYLDVSTVPITYDGKPALQTSAVDLTGRKKMEQALRDSEETGRVILDATPSSLALLDSDGRLLAANRITATRLGLKLEEILGKPIHQFFPEEIVKTRRDHVAAVFKTGRQISFEDTRNGLWFENNVYPVVDADGQVTRVVVSARDVTERKRMEQSLAEAKEQLEARVAERTRELIESQDQLRKLTTEVVLAQEEERRRVSRELHDEAGQALVSMKYGLEAILADLKDQCAPIRKRLTSAIQQLDQTMEQIRFLAHSLRPPLLDIADLDLTLRDYCREFGESTGLQIDYTGDPVPSLADQTGIAFFRFLQEALTNVAKHARATRVRVRLRRRARRLSLLVADNGVGPTATAHLGQGHLGMYERFCSLNGRVQIRFLPGLGFTIAATIPFLKEWVDGPTDA